MAQLPLAQGAYKRGDGPQVRLLNMFFEQDPRNIDTQVSLTQKPGEVLFATCGSGPIRGVFRKEGVLGGDFVVVSGTAVYRVTVGGTPTLMTGTVSGTGRVSIDGLATTVYIANGAGVYSLISTTVSAFTFPDTAGVTAVAVLNGYVVFARAASHKFYWLIPGSVVIDGLDFLSAESAADNLVDIRVMGDELSMLGAGSTEFFDPTGDVDFPFLRVSGRLFSQGCANRDTVALVSGLMLWVGEDALTGSRQVYRCASVPEVVSDNSVAEKLRLATGANLRAWSFGIDGHLFYALTTGNETLVLDLTTGTWTEFGSYGLTGWRCHLGASRGDGRVIAGDSVNGKLWLLDPDLNTDNAGPMIREWPARMSLNGQTPIRNVRMDVSPGRTTDPAADPMIEMLISTDGTETWESCGLEPLGRQGEFNTMPTWTRLGMADFPGVDFLFRVTDDVKVTARRALVNESLR